MQCPTLSLGQSFIITSNVYEYEHSCRNKRKDVLLVYIHISSTVLSNDNEYAHSCRNKREDVQYNYTYTYISSILYFLWQGLQGYTSFPIGFFRILQEYIYIYIYKYMEITCCILLISTFWRINVQL